MVNKSGRQVKHEGANRSLKIPDEIPNENERAPAEKVCTKKFEYFSNSIGERWGEQIVGTRQKPQWIVSQVYSHTYNSRMQLNRL